MKVFTRGRLFPIKATEKKCVFQRMWTWQEEEGGDGEHRICRQHCHQLGRFEEVAQGALSPIILLIPPIQATPCWHCLSAALTAGFLLTGLA